MQFSEAIKLALQSLWGNKMRTILTLLGVVIGVASVIMVVTLVNGANHFVETKVRSYGADVFTASKQPGVILDEDDLMKYQKRKDLKFDDYLYVAEKCTSCSAVAADAASTGRVVYGNQSSTDTTIRGWTSEMASINNIAIDQGRGITPTDEEHGSHVAIIGYDIVDNQMGQADPIGKEIRIDGGQYTVVGVGERKGKTFGQSQDNWAAMPLKTFLTTHGYNRSVTIYGRAATQGDGLQQAADQVRVALRSRRHDAVGTEDSFAIETNETFMQLWKSLSTSFFAVFIAISSISLVIGGIVIMNIMLVSVTERTREIGVRKALGARRNDVMLQFLIESATMSLAGGVVGVIVGCGIAETITLVIGFPSAIQLWSIVAGLFVATTVGIFFGVYPARKAAMLDPIVALRSEM